MKYELNCRYDARKSFYGKAVVEEIETDENTTELILYSYNTVVARIEKGVNWAEYYYGGKYSQTTKRHQKEFFKQHGLTDKEIIELFKNKQLVKEW